MGAAIWSWVAPVLVRVMVCWVATVPGTLAKTSALGLRARPGSGEPNPLSAAVAVPAAGRDSERAAALTRDSRCEGDLEETGGVLGEGAGAGGSAAGVGCEGEVAGDRWRGEGDGSRAGGEVGEVKSCGALELWMGDVAEVLCGWSQDQALQRLAVAGEGDGIRDCRWSTM